VIKIKTNEQDKIQIRNSEIPAEKTSRMPIFQCSCGASILIVPDLPEMDKAIKAHIIEHKRVTGQRFKEEIIIQLIIKTITEYQS
jgi:hypothetical protein